MYSLCCDCDHPWCSGTPPRSRPFANISTSSARSRRPHRHPPRSLPPPPPGSPLRPACGRLPRAGPPPPPQRQPQPWHLLQPLPPPPARRVMAAAASLAARRVMVAVVAAVASRGTCSRRLCQPRDGRSRRSMARCAGLFCTQSATPTTHATLLSTRSVPAHTRLILPPPPPPLPSSSLLHQPAHICPHFMFRNWRTGQVVPAALDGDKADQACQISFSGLWGRALRHSHP